MVAGYPVRFDVARPGRFERAQVVLRVLLLVGLWLLGGSLGWILLALYLALPLYAGVSVSGKGGARFLADDGPRLTAVIRWVVSLFAYLGLVTDRFPTGDTEELVHLDIERQGEPTVGSALLRLLTSIPSWFVLAILSIAFWLVWIVAAVWVLFKEAYPAGLYRFERAIIRWLARLLGYHASLVEEYPPFSVDTGALEPPSDAERISD